MARGDRPLRRLGVGGRLTPGTVAIAADETARYTAFAMSLQNLEAPAGSVTLWQLGSDVAAGRNRACESLQGDWLFFVDDDHAFAPDILMRLLNHDKPIVAPNVLRRHQPFKSVACVDDKVLELEGEPRLVEVQHTGSSGMLIRREVIEAVEPPWFELGNGISEDVNFCRKARAAGFDIHVDLGTLLGHISTVVIWPAYDGKWSVGLSLMDGSEIGLEP